MNRLLYFCFLTLSLLSPLPASAEPMVSVFGQQAPLSKAREFATVNNLVNQSKFEEALPLAKTLVESEPNLGAARWAYSKILHHKKQYREAYNQAKYACQLNPSYDNAYVSLGIYAMSIGKRKEALKAFKTYLKLSPNTKRASLVRGYMKAIQNEMELSKKVTIKSPPGTYLADVVLYGVHRFTRDKMPLKVYIDRNAVSKGFRLQFVDVLKQSFRKWQMDTSNTVSFQFVDKPTDAYIECYWTDDPTKLTNPAEGGHTQTSDGETGRVSAEIVLLTMLRGKPATSLEIERIGLHEIGHAIGLTGHSTSQKDIMFMSVSESATLSKRDIATLLALYKLKPSKPTGDSRLSDPTLSAKGRHRAVIISSNATRLLKANKEDEAIKEYERAISIDPGYKGAYFNLSIAHNTLAVKYAKAKKYDLAKTHIESSIEALKKYGDDKKQLTIYLTNYRIILAGMGKEKEAQAVSEQLKNLGNG